MEINSIKALSILQPWASAIAEGKKSIETRSWRTSYRGILLIHAGKGKQFLPYGPKHPQGAGFPGPFSDNWIGGRAMKVAGFDYHYEFPLGAIIAVAELVGCHLITPTWTPGSILHHCRGEANLSTQELALGDYTPGRFGWVLNNVRKLPEPIPYKGRQKLFDVPREALSTEALAVIEGGSDA